MDQDTMTPTDRFLSCDWGTTAFRLRLVKTDGLRIIATTSSGKGNKEVYAEWTARHQPEEGRLGFYLAIIRESIRTLEEQGTGRLDGVPVIISGMASSTIGMMELPYKALPLALDGADLHTKHIPPDHAFPYPLLLISGARTDSDVMRGEETQIVGCALADTSGEQLLIHTGTHAKHAVIRGGQLISFQTFMTGELFSLISTKSILASGVVAEEAGPATADNQMAFEQGVKDGVANNLLHILFMVRTADLFRKRSKTENYHYLSGLLIGYELSAFPAPFTGTIILAGNTAMTGKYKAAMEVLGIVRQAKALILKDEEEITVAGQYAVYSSQAAGNLYCQNRQLK